MKTILISEKDNKITLSLSEGLTFSDIAQLLSSALHQIAKSTVIKLTESYITSHRDTVKTKRQKEAVRLSVQEDIADMLNFAFSNVLNDICPKDPDHQLSEVAIATMENIIINNAANNKVSIEEALADLEANLANSKYAAIPTKTSR